MDFVLWVLFGAIAAWIAGIYIGAHNLNRLLGSIALGIIGAVFAGAIMQAITGHNEGGVNYYSLLLATAFSLCITAVASHKKV